tara:strand:+ start:311 stop:1009 length:699 start_codon:yes stop_codon:yes gene_type:complete
MADPKTELQVLVVDDHAITVAGIEGLLRKHLSEDSVISSCSDTSEALSAIVSEKPDIVVCDLDFGNERTGGFSLAEAAWEAESLSKFIMYTGADVNKAALLGEARGLVGKNIFAIESKVEPTENLLKTIAKVADGVRPYDSFSVRVAKSQLPDQDLQTMESFGSLTERQLEIVAAYATHDDRKSVAETLGISDSTVKNSISRILQVFNVDSMRTVVARYKDYQDILSRLGAS